MKQSFWVWGVGVTALGALALSSSGCGAEPPAVARPVSPGAAATSAPPAVSAAGVQAVASPPAPASAQPSEPAVPSRVVSAFEHSLKRPVLSLAVGAPRVSALVEEAGEVTPWLLEAGAWRPIPLPPQLKVTSADLKTARIFFGRDDRPRIMGERTSLGQAQPLYLRWRGGEWRTEKAEIGRLAGAPAAGLFGVLGHADPEVVCKAGDQCIIKRRTGWQTLKAMPGVPRVILQGPEAFAIYPGSVSQLIGSAWQDISAGARLSAARGVWHFEEELWISDQSQPAQLWRRQAGAWSAVASPIKAPEQLWGSERGNVWLVGGGGLAHFDGESWSRIENVPGPLSEVYSAGAALWVAGASGAWVAAAGLTGEP